MRLLPEKTTRFLFLCGILVGFTSTGFAQVTHWNLVDGRAVAEKKITVTGKTQVDIYKDVYRWLIKVYHDPEDILKARIENEYIRGEGYELSFLQLGAMTHGDLQYSFEFHIKDEKVLFKIFNAFLLYSHEDGAHPVENYLTVGRANKNKGNEDIKMVLASLNTFSDSLFHSLENHLMIK